MEQDLNKKQNRKVTVFAIILSIISIGLLVGGFLLVSSDKVVMLQSISNLSSKLESALDDTDLSDKIAFSKDIGVKANLKLSSESAGIDASLIFDYLENQTDKKSKFDIDFSMNNQNLLGLDGVLANDNLYLNVDGITPNYYYTTLEYVNILSSLQGKDYDKILALLKETVTDYIDEKDIKKEKVEINYNGKDKKVNKLSYAITNEVIRDLITNFVDSLKKDKELLNNMADYLRISSEEMVTNLDSFVKELTYDEVKVGCYYNVYYYGFNKIVKYELADESNKPVIEYKVEEKEIINLYSDEIKVLSLEVEKNKDGYTFNGFIKDTNEDVDMPFIGSIVGDKLTITIDQEDIDVKLAITSTEEIKENNYISKNKIVLYGLSEGEEITVGTLELNLEYYFGEKVNVDISNSVDMNQMTENDMNTIQNNLMNHPLFQLIIGMSGDLGLSL